MRRPLTVRDIFTGRVRLVHQTYLCGMPYSRNMAAEVTMGLFRSSTLRVLRLRFRHSWAAAGGMLWLRWPRFLVTRGCSSVATQPPTTFQPHALTNLGIPEVMTPFYLKSSRHSLLRRLRAPAL